MTIKKSFWILVILAPPVVLLYLIFIYGLNVPVWDQWDFVPLLEKLYSGKIAFSQLWAQHNEHRLFFPKIIMLIMAYITHWDIRYELYANVALAGAALLFLYSLWRKSIRGPVPLFLLAILSMIIFSPAQWENWTWGWTIQIWLSVWATVASIWAMQKERLKGLILAIASAIVASYSFNNGILTWIVLLLMAIQQRRSKREIMILLSASTGVIAAYYYSYRIPAHHLSFLHFILHPLEFLRYVLAYLGLPLGGGDMNLSAVFGIAITIIALMALNDIRRYSRDEMKKLLPWLALALYAFLSACATAVGRLEFGLSSRYITISNMFLISGLAIVVSWLKFHIENHDHLARISGPFFKFASVLCLAGYALSFFQGYLEMGDRYERLKTGMSAIRKVETASDEQLELLYPQADIIRKRVPILRAWRLSLFKDSEPDDRKP
jgi:hypothetical protein